MSADNPFLVTSYQGHRMGPVTAADRVAAVARFSEEQCEAALQVPGLQKTVIEAIKRRRRQLART